jgi:PDZ domain-containing secreted protein
MKKQIKSDTLILKNILLEKKSNNLAEFVKDKTHYIQEIIRETIISILRKKKNDIFSNNDISLSINILNELYEKTKTIQNDDQVESTNEKNIECLQKIIDKLSMVICGFGTNSIDDLLFITFGSDFSPLIIKNEIQKDKYNLIRKYLHPIGYKIIHWKANRTIKSNDCLCSNKITDETLFIENANMFECFDAEKTTRSFSQKIYGIRVIVQNEKEKKTLIINGIVDDIQIDCLNNLYIKKRLEGIMIRGNNLSGAEAEVYKRVIDTLSFKEFLTLGDEDIYKKMIAVFTETNIIKSNKLDASIKRFLEMDIYNQRNLLVNLLLNNSDFEIQYICYLLYDLISIHSIDNGDTKEQIMIYDSLPWKIRSYFKDVINFTIKNTNDMIQKYDINKISLEQQIYLLKADDTIKERAMIKLKEVKTKSDEMGMKAKQYLEGLIKIPFGVYREEPVLKQIKEMNSMFSKLMNNYCKITCEPIIQKLNYTNFEMRKIINEYKSILPIKILSQIKQGLESVNIKTLNSMFNFVNNVLKSEKKEKMKVQTKEKKKDAVINFIENAKEEDKTAIYELLNLHNSVSIKKTTEDIENIYNKSQNLELEMKKIEQDIEDSVHGHAHAKNQIFKIIAQWINGEQTGYSFGFEGSPGIGKTSLAKKGLANCLKNEDGITRPYAFIALGGSSSGKTLEGHGYTYVNSTWGKIVDILMESKCMNPIIYIDELDKVSKTEEGKEIIGILIHLIDQTQNDLFQDKYFSGINLDLSKALFIFSYNDPDQIDKILLDRIHRVKFDNLTIKDKVIIAKKYILPEINKKMGFINIIDLSDKIIVHIIETYTLEPGVRKLKEIIFDLYGEINIELLKGNITNTETPINISVEQIQKKYLKKYKEIQKVKIHEEPLVGVINGLWANNLGMGGILPIEAMLFPCETFLELKLTGMQGDVMKESMNVAKSLAWNLTDNETKKNWIKVFEETRCKGLHIHCPEGAISKDGPSAGVAITTVIYSLLNNKKIKNNVAMTGEITLQGKITAIGGLKEKIMGAIKNKVKTILYPKDNHREFSEFYENHGESCSEEIVFIEVDRISEVLDFVFV